MKGGWVSGAWPGLSPSELYEGRDIRPTTDYESLFKAVAIGRPGLSPAFVEGKVFPNSRASAPAEDLFRTG